MLTIWLDAQFNALKQYVIPIEKIDLENGEKTEKKMEYYTFRDSSSHLTSFSQD